MSTDDYLRDSARLCNATADKAVDAWLDQDHATVAACVHSMVPKAKGEPPVLLYGFCSALALIIRDVAVEVDGVDPNKHAGLDLSQVPEGVTAQPGGRGAIAAGRFVVAIGNDDTDNAEALFAVIGNNRDADDQTSFVMSLLLSAATSTARRRKHQEAHRG